jgi:hypothetical protein
VWNLVYTGVFCGTQVVDCLPQTTVGSNFATDDTLKSSTAYTAEFPAEFAATFPTKFAAAFPTEFPAEFATTFPTKFATKPKPLNLNNIALVALRRRNIAGLKFLNT